LDDLAHPVFLVQGFAADARVLRPLEQRIRRLGRATFCPSPPLGLGDLRDAAARLHEAIEEAAAATKFERADVIGHSMGGLIAGYLLKQLDRGRLISRVIALGTPFMGVPAARLGAWLLGPFGCSLRQMAPGSSLLQQLAHLPVPPGCALVSIAGTKDWLVPVAATRLPATAGHLHREAGALDHRDLLLRRRCFAHIERALEMPCRSAACASGRPLAA